MGMKDSENREELSVGLVEDFVWETAEQGATNPMVYHRKRLRKRTDPLNNIEKLFLKSKIQARFLPGVPVVNVFQGPER